MTSMPDVRKSHGELKAHYDALPADGGFDSFCKVDLPGKLSGLRVLDIACRRGKGVYKIAAAVGAGGRALGLDWRPAFIERARAGVPRAIERSGLAESNMEFVVGYPEDLAVAGIARESIDVVFMNAVLNVFFDPAAALSEASAALRPGGLLVCQTVLADGERDGGVVKRARAIGNVVQAAPAREVFASWLDRAGFDLDLLSSSYSRPIDITAAADAQTKAPVVPADEPVSFESVTVEARKPAARA